MVYGCLAVFGAVCYAGTSYIDTIVRLRLAEAMKPLDERVEKVDKRVEKMADKLDTVAEDVAQMKGAMNAPDYRRRVVVAP